MSYAAETYFFGHEVTVRYCNGNGTNRHVLVTKRSSQRRYIDLNLEAHAKHHGSVLAFVRDLFRVRKEPENVSECWRPFCNHRGNDVLVCTAMVSHPICLRINLPRPYKNGKEMTSDEKDDRPPVPVPFSDEPMWDFPAVIELPGTNKDGRRTTCHYDVVGRAVHSNERSHFFAYVADPLKRCYLYDDLANGGVLTKAKEHNKIKTVVAGQHRPTAAERTITVVYHLREGVRGQEDLLRWTQSELLAIHKVSMTYVSSSKDPPSFTIEDPLWREAKPSERLGSRKGDREPDTKEYEYEGHADDIVPIILKHRLEKDEDIDSRPKKKARFKRVYMEVDLEATPSQKPSLGSSSPVKTPTPRARKRKVVSSSPVKTSTPRAQKKNSVFSSPVTSPSHRARRTANETNAFQTIDPTPKTAPSASPRTTRSTTRNAVTESARSPSFTHDEVDTAQTRQDTPQTTTVASGKSLDSQVRTRSAGTKTEKVADQQARKPVTPRITRSSVKRQTLAPTAILTQSTTEARVAKGILPAKTAVTNTPIEPPTGRKRGRPRKIKVTDAEVTQNPQALTPPVQLDSPVTPKLVSSETEAKSTAVGLPTGRKRGRHRNNKDASVEDLQIHRTSPSPVQRESLVPATKTRSNHPPGRIRKYGKRANRVGKSTKSGNRDARDEGLVKDKLNGGSSVITDVGHNLEEDDLKDEKGDNDFESEERDDEDADIDADGSTDDGEQEDGTGATKNEHTATAIEDQADGADSDHGLFRITCRCGIVEDRPLHGADGFQEDLIQCKDCENWSHQACQFRGFTAFLKPNDPFYCHLCQQNAQRNE